MSQRGYQEPTIVLAGGLHHSRAHDHTNTAGVSRDMPVHVCGVTNAVTRAIWPSSRCWHRHLRRSPSSVVCSCLLSVVISRQLLFIVHCHPCHCRPSAVLVMSSLLLPSSLEWDSQLAVAGDNNIFVWSLCRAPLCCPHHGVAWLLLCGHATRQCG